MKEALKTQFSITCDSLYKHPAIHWLLGDSLHPGGLSLTEHLGEKLALSPKSTALDVATGRGASARFLSEKFGCSVVGVDLVQENLVKARELSIDEGLAETTAYIRGDAENLPIATASLDALTCECSLSIFPDKQRAVEEMARVLKPGGRLGISDVTCRRKLPDRLKGVFAQVACIADVRSQDEYGSYLADAGLIDIETEDHGQELKKLVAGIKKKLGPLTLLSKLGSLKVAGAELGVPSNIKETLKEVDGMVEDGTLSYCLITARKPE